MKKHMATFIGIDNNRDIQKDDAFIYLMQHALLLSLYERGFLTFMQLRHAETLLQRKTGNHYIFP